MLGTYLFCVSIKVVLMSSKRKSRSVRRSEKRRRIQPPLRNGVNAAPLRLPYGRDGDAEIGVPWLTMGEWFEERFGVQGLKLLERTDVFAGHNVPLRANDPYRPGERIWVFRPVLDEPDEPIVLPVVAENERYVVVDKPHGMASVPKGSHVAQTVLVAARRQFSNDVIVAAHRLDLETAGLLLLVKDPQWRGAYQKMFQDRHVRKTYRAVAPIIERNSQNRRWHSELLLRKSDGQLRVEVIRERENASPENYSDVNGENCGSGDAGRCVNKNAQLSDVSDTCRAAEEKVIVGNTVDENESDVNAISANIIREKTLADDGGSANFRYYGEHRQAPVRNGSLAVTDIELVRSLAGKTAHAELALYRLYPHTGFTHQLRVAMNELGAPIYADPLYPEILSREAAAERPYPLQLLAASLDFIDPISGEPTHLESTRRLALE